MLRVGSESTISSGSEESRDSRDPESGSEESKESRSMTVSSSGKSESLKSQEKEETLEIEDLKTEVALLEQRTQYDRFVGEKEKEKKDLWDEVLSLGKVVLEMYEKNEKEMRNEEEIKKDVEMQLNNVRFNLGLAINTKEEPRRLDEIEDWLEKKHLVIVNMKSQLDDTRELIKDLEDKINKETPNLMSKEEKKLTLMELIRRHKAACEKEEEIQKTFKDTLRKKEKEAKEEEDLIKNRITELVEMVKDQKRREVLERELNLSML